MKLYFYVVFSLIVFGVQFGAVIPALVSAQNTLLVLIGLSFIIVTLPILYISCKLSYKEFKKKFLDVEVEPIKNEELR